jgi:dTDP-4-dehydrorhamnose reductase
LISQIVATGAAGMVGSYLPPGVVRLARQDLDVINLESVRSAVRDLRPDTVLHLAAATDVERSETDHGYAFRGNTLGTINVALACREFGVRMVYVSTGGVFSGDKRASTESDIPAPRNFYAWTKFEGEQIVSDLLPEGALIIRAGWMMGGGPARDHKFVGAMVRAFSTRNEVEVVDDRFGSPTFARHFVGTAIELTRRGATGTWHCANEGVCSRFEMATEIARFIGFSGRLARTSSRKMETGAPRGRSEGLDCVRLREAGLSLPEWRVALREYLAEFV